MTFYTTIRQVIETLTVETRQALSREIAWHASRVQRFPVIVICSNHRTHDDTDTLFQGQKNSGAFDEAMSDPTVIKIRFDCVDGEWVYKGFVIHVIKVNERAPGVPPRWHVYTNSAKFWKEPSSALVHLVREYYLLDKRSAYNKMCALASCGIFIEDVAANTQSGFMRGWVEI